MLPGMLLETPERKRKLRMSQNLMAYRVSLSLIDRLFSEGVITAADRRKSYTIIAKRHGLSLDSIFTEKT